MMFTLFISPFQTATLSLLTCAVSGYIFARLLRAKLLDWENNRISPLPIANAKTLFSWVVFFLGITILFTSALVIYDFSIKTSFVFSIVISTSSSAIMWSLIKSLMTEVQNGTVKELDQFF